MRILLIIQLLLFSPAYSQQLQSNDPDFQHQGLTEEVMNEACQDLGDKCREESGRSSGALEDIINQGPKIAFAFLVPATITSLIKANGQSQLKNMWNFKSIGSPDYLAETQKRIARTAEHKAGVASDLNKDIGQEANKHKNVLTNTTFIDPDEAQEHLEASYNDTNQNDAQDGLGSNTKSAPSDDEIKKVRDEAKANKKKIKGADTLKKICRLAAIGGVAGVWVHQKITQREAEDRALNPDLAAATVQYESLYAVSDLHKGKKNNAITLQSKYRDRIPCTTSVFLIDCSAGVLPVDRSQPPPVPTIRVP